MKKIINHSSENRKAGFTLVEVLIALAIFSVAVVPLLSSFAMAARLNMRGRQKEQAMTVAENVVEGIKAVGVASSYTWCTEGSVFTVIPDNADGTSMDKSASKSSSDTTVDLSACETSRGVLGDEYKAVSIKVTNYSYTIKKILMGNTYYDVTVTAQADTTTNKELLVPYAYAEDYDDAGMTIAMLYNIEATVTLHDNTTTLATYSATAVTQN